MERLESLGYSSDEVTSLLRWDNELKKMVDKPKELLQSGKIRFTCIERDIERALTIYDNFRAEWEDIRPRIERILAEWRRKKNRQGQ